MAKQVTVDDADSGIVYSQQYWLAQPGQSPQSSLKPPNAHGNTWHVVTVGTGYPSSYFEFSFQGTAVYIYGILGFKYTVNNESIIQAAANLLIDGELAANFQETLLDTEGYRYEQMMAREGLANANHKIRVNVVPGSNFMFDYLVYTESELSSATGSPNAGPNPTQLTASSVPGSIPSSTTPIGTAQSSGGNSTMPSSNVTNHSGTSNDQAISTPSMNASRETQSQLTMGGGTGLATSSIIAIVFGAAIFIALAGFGGLLYFRRRHRRNPSAKSRPKLVNEPDTYPGDTASISGYSDLALLQAPVYRISGIYSGRSSIFRGQASERIELQRKKTLKEGTGPLIGRNPDPAIESPPSSLWSFPRRPISSADYDSPPAYSKAQDPSPL